MYDVIFDLASKSGGKIKYIGVKVSGIRRIFQDSLAEKRERELATLQAAGITNCSVAIITKPGLTSRL